MMKPTTGSPKRLIRYWHLSCLLFLCTYYSLISPAVVALPRDRSITQLHHTAWTAKDSAPGRVRDIVQDNEGYLWLGTATGLYRFDGIQFDHYLPRLGDDFPSSNIDALLATPDGGLWISYLYGGVSFLKDGNLINFGEHEGLPPGRVRRLARDNEGTVWAAVQGGLAKYDGLHWQRVGIDWNFSWKMAQTVFVDGEGTLWVATEDTLVFLPKGTRTFQPTGERISEVQDITQSRDKAIWIAETSRSVRQIKQAGVDRPELRREIAVRSRRILFDSDGAFWIPTIGQGVQRIPYPERDRSQSSLRSSQILEKFTEEEGLSANYIFAAFEDREGNIWIGTANGLDRFRASSAVRFHIPSSYHDFGLAVGIDGEIWTGGPTTGVHVIRNDTSISIAPDLEVLLVYRDLDGAIWFGGNRGIYRSFRNKISKVDMPSGLNVLGISALFKDREGILWIYIDHEGLFQLKDGAWEQYARQEDLSTSSPITGAIDSSDRKWLGYSANRLIVIDENRIRTFSKDDGLAVGDVKVIKARRGRVWIGGSNGLAFFEGERLRTLKTDGPERLGGISGIVESRDGSLWLNSEKGVIHIEAGEIQIALTMPDHNVRYRVFDFRDGVPGAAQQNRPFPTAVEASDGRLWFSTNKGLAWIDPQLIPKNLTPPPVSFKSIAVEGKSYELLPYVELPEGTTNVQIEFTALSLSIPERLNFRYQLEGVDAVWQESGTRRQAFYNNLGPGRYRFRMTASNHDGVWNQEGAVLEFSIAPTFYQTLWFRSLMFLFSLLSVAAFLILLYRWRLASATKRLSIGFEERLAERTRIAHDLHDTLLQGFFGATMRLQAVANLLPTRSDEAKKNIDEVLDQIDGVLEDGRRAIWDMHALSIGETDLAQAFALVAEDLNKIYPTSFSLTIEGDSRPLHPLVRDQIYRIGREALINAFRHAKASEIEVEIEYSAKHLRLLVRDNGCGISSDYLDAGKEGHLGLPGMRECAESIKAELKIWSAAQSGTEVQLVVPH